MSEPRRHTPPLSPVLLAGFLTWPLPPILSRPFLAVAMEVMRRRHGETFERLRELGVCSFLIDPVDLPFVFLLRLGPRGPSLTMLDAEAAPEAGATIRGPLLKLLDMLEGRIDGDALFFSRDLVIAGDTEAVVALRNIVDGAEIDVLADVLSVLGPFGRPARRVAGGAAAVFARAAEDLETLRAAAIAPALRRTEALSTELRGLEERLDNARDRRGRGRGRARNS